MSVEKNKAKQKQTMRYSDEELALIKSVFSENDELLLTIRKVMLQAPLSSREEAYRQEIAWLKQYEPDRNKRFLIIKDIYSALSSHVYGNIVSYEEAKDLLK